MAIGGIEMTSIVRSQDYTAIKFNEDSKGVMQQSNLITSMHQQEEQRAKQVNQGKDADWQQKNSMPGKRVTVTMPAIPDKERRNRKRKKRKMLCITAPALISRFESVRWRAYDNIGNRFADFGNCHFCTQFFVFGGNSRQDLTEIREEVKEEVRQAVNVQMAEAGRRWEDTLREKAEDAVNNTERELSKVSNEKIMAVSEYSDTVLAEIDKNHKEAMFLYDMLNDKHKDIGRTIDLATDFKGLDDIAEETFETNTPVAEVSAYEEASAETQTADSNSVKETKSGTLQMNQTDISFMQDGGNNNERILELHKQGKSNVSIAKELGLGVGEVKLVIDLFEGMK